MERSIAVELRQLQYFLNVARKQHVTQASEELHVAQSAISRQIHQLEEELGVQLFVQKGRNLQLTPVGRLFMARIEHIMAELEQAIEEVHDFLDPEMGEIRIGFPHSLGVSLVPRVVADFKMKHPNVKFKFKQGKFNSLIQDIRQREIDLAFISPFPEGEEAVTGETLLTEEMYVILPPNHPLAQRSQIRLDELKEESFVLFSQGYSLRPIVWDACLQAGFTPKIGFEGEETDTIRGLVAAGMGVSLLPEMAISDGGPLQPVKVKLSEPEVSRTIGLIRRKNETLPLVAEIFHRFLMEYFRCRSER